MAKKKLADYQAKRDFKKTSEPSGKTKVRAAEYPRFVIQKHAATRLHYDLRLEHDGVFKSWAVTKGPSLNPADKRLAVEVEDHPLDYGDFEGTIPKGEYGGGTVMLWDRGFWMPEGTKDVDAALRKGELKFTLAGEKLQGSFVLVRMKHDRDHGKRNNWLLIKHRDEFARESDDVTDEDQSVASGRSLEQIAAGKGRGAKPFMAAGAKASDPGAIWHSKPAKEPKTKRRAVATLQSSASARKTSRAAATAMPRFIAPQLCKTLSRPPQGDDWVHEIKFDGYRMQLRTRMAPPPCAPAKASTGRTSSRPSPKPPRAYPMRSSTARSSPSTTAARPTSPRCRRRLSDGRSQDLVFFVFDLLFDARRRSARPSPLQAQGTAESAAGQKADPR